MLDKVGGIAGPNLSDELDVVWWIVKARRNRIAHMKGWLDREGGGLLAVTRRGLVIAGVPGGFSLVTGSFWSSTLDGWAAELGRIAFEDEEPGAIPSRVDEDDVPAWANNPPKRWKGGSPSPPV